MAVMKCVENAPPAALANHQPKVTQDTQLMRNGRLLHPNRVGQFTDRAGAFSQASEDPNTARSSQRLHRLGHLPRHHSIYDAGATLRPLVIPVAHIPIIYERMLIRSGYHSTPRLVRRGRGRERSGWRQAAAEARRTDRSSRPSSLHSSTTGREIARLD